MSSTISTQYKCTGYNINNIENDNEPLLLSNVVWVKHEKWGWWPSEIISTDKSKMPLFIRLFGQEGCILELHDISKSSILPFHDESSVQLRKTGGNSSMKTLFNKAIIEAMIKETEENDGLPSKDFVFKMIVDSTEIKECSNKDKLTSKQGISYLSDFDLGKDETLQIPGEYVLSVSKHHPMYQKRRNCYYPAKIIDYCEPDKYKVLFCDNSSGTVNRKDFYTKYEDGFKTCELGEFEMEFEVNPTYDNPELVEKVQSLEPILDRILRGVESSWRYENFCMGGNKRNLLASKVSPGPFDLNQFELIAKVLRSIFIPEIAKSVDGENKMFIPVKLKNSIMLQQTFFENLSNNLKLRFVNDVLLPETIIRLVMIEEKLEYGKADHKLLNGYKEVRWVEQLMAERASFQIGSESLKERLKWLK